MPEYFKPGGPTLPLRVEPGRMVVDAADYIWLDGAYHRDNYTAEQGVLKGGVGAANCDTFTHELVKRYNQHEVLVALISTIIREVSPPSAHAFHWTDLPRIYFHLMKQMRDMGIDITGPGGPAILEIPPMPEDMSDEPQEDVWSTAWLEGYNSAWDNPSATTSTAETQRETER